MSCPFGAGAASLNLVDGCAHAPAGTPQYPTLLSSYGADRPPWDVAGVDYPVGVPSNITLKDPTGGTLPSCASYDASSHVVTVTASNCTIDGYDFTKGGGLQLSIPGGISDTTVSNDLFGLDGNPPVATAFIDRRGGSVTVTNSTFQGSGGVAYFDSGASGTATFQYDYFYDLDGDAMDFGSSQAVIVEYDSCVKIGMAAGTHPDCVQFCGGTLDPSSHESFVLSYQPVGVTVGGAEGVQVAQQCGGTITAYSVDHNTIIAAPDGSNVTMSCSIAVADNVNVTHNYIDASGAYYPFYPTGNGQCVDNIAMTSGSEYSGGTTYNYAAGSAITGTFGTLSCN
jgi:hypothetical protein